MPPHLDPARVLRCAALDWPVLDRWVRRCGMQLHRVVDGEAIPGSHWGDEEAGLIRNQLYVRGDTPVHSLLHELCHWLCMDAERRRQLHTDAGGSDLEESGVCYLQALLADELPGYSQSRLFEDMDDWGYTFVLGSAQRWFAGDANDARDWLQRHGLMDRDGRFGGQPRGATPSPSLQCD